jgi:transposase InsO family protein
MISTQDRQAAVELIDEAWAAGACKQAGCRELGLSLRTYQRWNREGIVGSDGRPGAVRPVPVNKLSATERAQLLRTVNEPRFAHLAPTQIVPLLADEGRYLASESTLYRILRDEQQLAHRAASRKPTHRAMPRHCARAPNELWCWDITYLPGPVQGQFFFLYLVLDAYSRKIVAQEVEAQESGEHAARLIERAVWRERIAGAPLVIHQDNGSPMKASSFVAKLEELGIRRSYSRPGVSDDNPYAESLFRTCKYRPDFPGAFAELDAARAWVLKFTRWYNDEHKHRALKFVSPAQRHRGSDRALLARRTELYERARAKHPTRWSGTVRNWSAPDEVWLNRPAARVETV